ncbi:MAG: ATP-binding cassette domain-containing protein [Planctomycetaceae bacterium]|nr:ATP-binding cassette domain-containing protein [Planctomycetaceae bacterium]
MSRFRKSVVPAPVTEVTSAPAATGVEPDAQLAVSVRELNHFYGQGELRKQVLFDNRLDLLRGEIVVMTGPSGSGKTTLLTLIGALRTVQDGQLRVLDQDLHRLSAADLVRFRQRVGFIFQTHNLFDSLTARQNVRMALELGAPDAHQANTRVDALLTELGLGHRLGYKPGQLSVGQRQRVAIARALANFPGLVLADEPTAALDKQSGRDVMNLLQRTALEQQTTVLIVTHDSRVLDAADRIVNMVDGQIISDVRVKEAALVCAFLRNCPLFASLTPGTLSSVADKVQIERHPAGSVVVRQGDPGDKFYVIKSGTLEVLIEEEGEVRPGKPLGSGEFFGEIALMTGETRTATVRTQTEAELYSLGKDEFQRVLDSSDSFEAELRKVVFDRQ